jgi:hypothetical protein
MGRIKGVDWFDIGLRGSIGVITCGLLLLLGYNVCLSFVEGKILSTGDPPRFKFVDVMESGYRSAWVVIDNESGQQYLAIDHVGIVPLAKPAAESR